MKPSVLVVSWASEAVLTDLRRHFDVSHVDIFEDGVPDAAELARLAEGKDGLLIHMIPVSSDLLVAGKGKLKVLANASAGADNVDLETATAAGIQVTNTPGVLTDAVADFGMAMVLAVGRRLGEAERYARAGKLDTFSFPLFWGTALQGETLGIVGMGRIGQALARRAKGFGIDIAYHNRNPVAPEIEAELGATWMPFDRLLAEARFVLLLTPLTPETRHLIGAPELAAMRKDGYLINIARGPVVHEEALLTALQEGQIAGAGLDVYEFEPKVTDGFKSLDTVFLTPHIASATVQSRHGMIEIAAANLKAVLFGEPVPNPVNTLD
jgi:lactate dehydrogenase-like 2-hydroxyacid dehydrogenase